MKGRKGAGVGSVSLVLVFSVLCLTVFAVLTLSSATAEKRLSDKLAGSVTAYYAADSRATEVFWRLKNALQTGEIPGSMCDVDLYTKETNKGITIEYACEISESRSIQVSLSYDGESLYIERWGETEPVGWSADENIEVWGGN